MRVSTKFICFVIFLFGLASCGGGGGSSSGGNGSGQPTNSAPVANAGGNQTVILDNIVNLSAAASSDADGDSLTYSWALIPPVGAGSIATLSSTDTVTTSFDVDSPGDYIVSLVVNDGTLDSAEDVITITAIDYMGTGNLTTGIGTTDVAELFPERGNTGRPAPLGTILDSNNIEWTVPADVRFQDLNVPFASDLFNPYGVENPNEAAALANLDASDIVEIDDDGELITAYVYADNYFEMYINGIAVGKDPVPFTEFNSSAIQFRVELPFTVAILLVDWEEELGTGTETDRNSGADITGDGGMVAVFKDEASNQIIGITDGSWRAQTFYTAPITDLTCLDEVNGERRSVGCPTGIVNDLSTVNGVHWELPAGWMNEGFDDSSWPNATTYTNQDVGVNRDAYNNFANVFDDATNDAQFIWSTNLVLDNEVVVRQEIDD